MSKTLKEIAQKLKDTDKKVQLIYAFNGTGKTRLSQEFKQLVTSPKDNSKSEYEADQPELSRTRILYYNAFTEDLFYWDNDLKSDADPKLCIQPNIFTPLIFDYEGQDMKVIGNFQKYTNDKLTPRFNENFSEVTFSFQRGNDDVLSNIKISKGEESNFIWSIFYTFLEQVINTLNVPEPDDRETRHFDQLEYVFIDDPVSSLDENNLIEMAVNLAQLITSNSHHMKFIITTHSTLFYNVLYNELNLKNKKGSYLLNKHENGTFTLDEKPGDSNKSFSYHLYLKQTIELAIANNQVQRYHFTLLRNLYEKTANFLGYERWSELLPDDKQAYLNRIIQFTSHNTLSNETIAEPTEQEKQIVTFLLKNLIDNYGYSKRVKK